jgi:hypothetical protein
MWTADEFEIVWHHASDALHRAITLACYAGMRVGDVSLSNGPLGTARLSAGVGAKRAPCPRSGGYTPLATK